MNNFINTALMANWRNWLIVPGIVMLGGLALYLITHPQNAMPTNNGDDDNG